MKRITDYGEYEEQRSFRITNEQRPYFGLNIIDERWEEVLVKEGTTVFYDGNIVKKIITWENSRFYEYTEIDTEIMTQERKYILSKNQKVKLRKLLQQTYLHLYHQAVYCIFRYILLLVRGMCEIV